MECHRFFVSGPATLEVSRPKAAGSPGASFAPASYSLMMVLHGLLALLNPEVCDACGQRFQARTERGEGEATEEPVPACFTLSSLI
jgi:hypothetical protein